MENPPIKVNIKKEFDLETQRLLQEGKEISVSIEKFLSYFQRWESVDNFTEEKKQELQENSEQIIHWFNEIKLLVLPRTLYGEKTLFEILQDVLLVIKMLQTNGNRTFGIQPSEAIAAAKRSVEEALTLIRSARQQPKRKQSYRHKFGTVLCRTPHSFLCGWIKITQNWMTLRMQ
jgi:hypothetical protein